MRLLLTRPEAGPEPDPMHAALAAAGHRVTHVPLLSVTLSGPMPPLAGVQALIATSRNGLRAVAPLSAEALALPLFAVGPATATLGRELGFRRVIEGPGTGRELADVIRSQVDPAAGPLIHLAGDTLAFDLQSALPGDGIKVRTEVVYRTEPVSSLAPEAADGLRDGSFEGVVLMSPRTARVYAKLAADAGLVAALGEVVHFCLSQAVCRDLAPLGSLKTKVARSPNSQEMLALIAPEASDSA